MVCCYWLGYFFNAEGAEMRKKRKFSGTFQQEFRPFRFSAPSALKIQSIHNPVDRRFRITPEVDQ
jgi:hypothetical protein